VNDGFATGASAAKENYDGSHFLPEAAEHGGVRYSEYLKYHLIFEENMRDALEFLARFRFDAFVFNEAGPIAADPSAFFS
jgi:hypothetical protein